LNEKITEMEEGLTDIVTSMNGKSASANPLVILIASFKDFLHLLRYTIGGAWLSAKAAESPRPAANACESVRKRTAMAV
jgi:hypothetical protein